MSINEVHLSSYRLTEMSQLMTNIQVNIMSFTDNKPNTTKGCDKKPQKNKNYYF